MGLNIFFSRGEDSLFVIIIVSFFIFILLMSFLDLPVGFLGWNT